MKALPSLLKNEDWLFAARNLLTMKAPSSVVVDKVLFFGQEEFGNDGRSFVTYRRQSAVLFVFLVFLASRAYSIIKHSCRG